MILALTGNNRIAEAPPDVYKRQTLLSNWLVALGVDPDTAVKDACRIEHVISSESFEAIKAHAQRNS